MNSLSEKETDDLGRVLSKCISRVLSAKQPKRRIRSKLFRRYGINMLAQLRREYYEEFLTDMVDELCKLKYATKKRRVPRINFVRKLTKNSTLKRIR